MFYVSSFTFQEPILVYELGHVKVLLTRLDLSLYVCNVLLTIIHLRPQMGPMLAPWTLLSGFTARVYALLTLEHVMGLLTPLDLSLYVHSSPQKPLLIHELGHVLDFYHEHSRPDRDDYVTIHPEHVFPDWLYKFIKYPTSSVDSHDIPYDYASIMHYSAFVSSQL